MIGSRTSSGTCAISARTRNRPLVTGFAAIRPSETLLRDYPDSIFCATARGQDSARRRRRSVPEHFTRPDCRDIEIPLPPLEEQRRIVAEIEGYQKVLDGARQILAGYSPASSSLRIGNRCRLAKFANSSISGENFDDKQADRYYSKECSLGLISPSTSV